MKDRKIKSACIGKVVRPEYAVDLIREGGRWHGFSGILNAPYEMTYVVYAGEESEMIQMMKEDFRVPMSVSEIMQKRLATKDCYSNRKLFNRDGWWSNIDSGDVIVYHPDGRFKIALDSQLYLERKGIYERDIGDGRFATCIPEMTYERLIGEGVYELHERDVPGPQWKLKKPDVKTHPIWRLLARDQSLLEEYVDYVFTWLEPNQQYKKDEGMNISHPSYNYTSPKTRVDAVPEIRNWMLCGDKGQRCAANPGCNWSHQKIFVGIVLE